MMNPIAVNIPQILPTEPLPGGCGLIAFIKCFTVLPPFLSSR